MGLNETQEFVGGAIQKRTPIAEIAPIAARTPAFIRGSARLSPIEQLDIYRDQFRLRHVDAMREDFGSIAHLVGDGAFEAMCFAYFERHPSTSFTLRDLGADFPRFVAETAPFSADPLVADLARTEWAFVEAFDAPDAPPLDPQKIAAMPEDAWPSARIVLHPAMQRLALGFAAQDYRAAVKNGGCPARPAAHPTWLVVYRGATVLQYIDIDAGAFALLGELADGAPLGAACERVAEKTGIGAAIEGKIGQWFQEWTSYGWVVDVVAP